MAIAASVVIDKAATTLYDETNIRWTEAELLSYLNEGILAVLAYKPDAYVVDAAVALVAGSRQTIPSTGVELLDVMRNEGDDGATPGGAIRKVDKNFLDHNISDWHTTTGSAVLHYVFDERNPTVFYVYPAAAGKYIRINYTGIPTRLTATTDNIPISEIYQAPLVNWVVAYAMAKNFKTGDINKSTAYLMRFNDFFGVKTTTQRVFMPTPPEEENV